MQGILALAPEEFFDRVVVGSLAARAIVEGSDFRFGAGGAGDDDLLRRLAVARGIEVEFVEHVTVGGERVSSTRIRGLIAEGRVAEAAQCLGRPYTYLGTVVEGHHRGGRLLGHPTVNVEAARFLVPAEGVYAGWAAVGGRRIGAAISVGRLPTFHRDHPLVVEAFLLDFDGELYGEQVALEFIEYLRPQAAFTSPEALRAQLDADCRRVRAIIAMYDFAANPGDVPTGRVWPASPWPRTGTSGAAQVAAGPSRKSPALLDAWPQGGPQKVWEAELPPGNGSPVVAGGKVYVTTEDNGLRCLDAATGQERLEGRQPRGHRRGVQHAVRGRRQGLRDPQRLPVLF